jgi:molybdenum cofactor cytidylyltransferase
MISLASDGSQTVNVIGVILAAGEGRRMGGNKALLPLGDGTFLGRCTESLARPGVSSLLAVLGHDADLVAAGFRPPRAVELVVNRDYRQGMLSSVLCGLEAAAARGAEAVLVHLVDHPLVAPETVDRVVAALVEEARIAVPSFDNRRGHPVGFAASTWPALRAVAPGLGARAVLKEHPDWVVHVPGDRGCVTGIDTPEDYARHTGRQPPAPWGT